MLPELSMWPDKIYIFIVLDRSGNIFFVVKIFY